MSTKLLIILIFLALMTIGQGQLNVTNPVFPVVSLGMCYDGVQILAGFYTGHDVKFAYNSGPAPGHTWLFVDNVPVDSYYGYVTPTYEWMFPEQTFDTFTELSSYIHERTSQQV